MLWAAMRRARVSVTWRASESSHVCRDSALLCWLQSHFGTSTIVHAHRMFGTPNVVIEHSLLGHRPNEARLATSANMCAARAAQNGQRRSCTKQAEKKSSACSFAGLEHSLPSFRERSIFSIRGSGGVAHSDIR